MTVVQNISTRKTAQAKGLEAVDELLSYSKKSEPESLPQIQKPSRFSKCLERVEKGEVGPIRVGEICIDETVVEETYKSGRVDTYLSLLSKNPNSQPGRPLVNVVGDSDENLRFELLTLPELVLASREHGKEAIHVLLVRLDKETAAQLSIDAKKEVIYVSAAQLSPMEIAKQNGFLELQFSEIDRSHNVRAEIEEHDHEFKSLLESIRILGIQSPPVVEVKKIQGSEDKFRFVCVSGHRRLLALEKLGFTKVQCGLKVFDSEKQKTLAALAENINRSDLYFLDKADGFRKLLIEGMTTREIAALLEKDVRSVSKYLRAAEWDQSVKKKIRGNKSKLGVRFLLNTLASGIRTTEELHQLINKQLTPSIEAKSKDVSAQVKTPVKVEVKNKLQEYFVLKKCSETLKQEIENALKYLALI